MFESHITITGFADSSFQSLCRNIGVKPVIITDDTGSSLRQLMTAKFHKTNNFEEAKNEMFQIASYFSKHVIRHKLEKIVGKHSQIPPHKYLEFHSKYEIPYNQISEFTDIVIKSGGHTSQNILKINPNNQKTFRFATARNIGVYQKMTQNLHKYQRINSIMECVVYDDNPYIDKNWHGCDSCQLKSMPAFLTKLIE